MFKRLKHNLGIKLLCLFTAVGLWVYVSASQSTLGKFPSSIPIKTTNIPSGLTAIYDTKVVNIKIMAEPSVWRQLSSESFSAKVDLSALTAGTSTVPINVTCSVPNVQIVSQDPENIIVTLEPIVSKDIAISKKIEGSAADGMTAGDIKTDPDHVTVKGAKSVVGNISEAIVVVNLNGESDNFTRTLPVLAYDEKGEIIKELEFDPIEVVASVPIVKASNNKTVGIKVKTSGTPKSGYYVSAVTSTPSVVDIIGPLSTVKDINFIETYAIDLTDQSSDFEKEVNLNIPGGLTLQVGTQPKVKVSIKISPNEISREMAVAINTDTVDSGYKVTNVSPSQLKVIVTGPSTVVNGLKTNDISYAPDLKGKNPGIYNFNIAASDINVPSDITVISVLPSAISVTIEHK